MTAETDATIKVTPEGEKVPVATVPADAQRRRASDRESLSQRAASIIERRDFVQHSWKPLLATAFVLIIVFDFMIAPGYIGYNRTELPELVKQVASVCKDSDDEAKQKECNELRKYLIDQNYRSWKPLTLSDGVGLFYLAIGSILTGVAVYGHRGKGS